MALDKLLFCLNFFIYRVTPPKEWVMSQFQYFKLCPSKLPALGASASSAAGGGSEMHRALRKVNKGPGLTLHLNPPLTLRGG